MAKRLILLAAFLAAPTAFAQVSVVCSDGCIEFPPDTERTLNLLLLEDDAAGITLTWRRDAAVADRESFSIRYGNPAQRDQLLDGGMLEFADSGDGWVATRTFSKDTLGRGTFIVATIREFRGRQGIVDWRPFRVKTLADSIAEAVGSDFSGNLSVELVPEFMQVSSAHGELPKHTGGDARVWWPIPESVCCVNVDLDGDHTGVPGLTITRSAVWESQADDWKQSVLDNIRGVANHFIDFGELQFRQSPDREINVGSDIGTVHIKHYYGAVTLFTNASTRNFSAEDLGLSGRKRYFSHETSANLKQKPDPRLWTSYSRREYSADPELLDLIARGVKDDGAIPGLSFLQQDNGDGGNVTYSVSFKARVMPWAVPDDDVTFQPGFVHADVVASRFGFGGVETGDEPGQESMLCRIIPCLAGSTEVNLNQPPDGYRVAQPMAVLGSQQGAVNFLTDDTLTASRSLDIDEDAINFPKTARFALAAHLRAGALIRVRERLFGTTVEEIVPVNSYAQYIIKYTVAMVPQTVIVASDEQIIPDRDDFDTAAPTPPPPPPWWKRLFDFLGIPGMIILGLVSLVVLYVIAPPLRVLFKAIANLLAAIIDRLTRLVRGKQP